jgi:hypothetical protein
MKKGGFKKSHLNIQYAMNGWAAYALQDFTESSGDSQKYVNVKLNLFQIITNLFSGTFQLDKVELLRIRALDCLIEHSMLFPPCESTYALHEIIHVIEQIPTLGPPRYSTLFMFERVNLQLKRMIKNRNKPFASMMKSYGSQEFVNQTIGYHFERMLAILKMFEFMPTDVNNIKNVLSCFQNLYIDNENNVFNLPNMKVNAMKGTCSSITLTIYESRQLSIALGNLSSDGSVLGNIMY